MRSFYYLIKPSIDNEKIKTIDSQNINHFKGEKFFSRKEVQ